MKNKTTKLASLAIAGLVSGAFIAPYAFAGDEAAPAPSKEEAKEKCGGKDGCGAKDGEKNKCEGKEEGKNSCKGEKGEKASCKGEDKNGCDHK